MSFVQAPPNPQAQDLPAGRQVRVVTAASLFDGHDAAINFMRRIIQCMRGVIYS